jgi:hypothetical protein
VPQGRFLIRPPRFGHRGLAVGVEELGDTPICPVRLKSSGEEVQSRVCPCRVRSPHGHSFEVLLRIYAKRIDGQDAIAERRIAEARREDGVRVAYVGMTSHLWMVTRGRLPGGGGARGGQKGRPEVWPSQARWPYPSARQRPYRGAVAGGTPGTPLGTPSSSPEPADRGRAPHHKLGTAQMRVEPRLAGMRHAIRPRKSA